jgi:superfamily II DNA or RNA helicase
MSFCDLKIKSEYRSLLDDVVRNFYTPILAQAISYKRAVGFFSSSALIELTQGIGGLIKNGGKIELIASPKLSEEDIAAIEDGFDRKDQIIEECLLRELRDPRGKFDEARLNLMSNLIAAGRLEIKIAFLEKDNHVGMFHEKMGLMYDAYNNIIAFTGSMNESANAFSHNYESIDVFTSWSQDEERVLSKQAAFNAMWNDYEPCIKVVNFQSIEKNIIERYKRTNIIDISCLTEPEASEAEFSDQTEEYHSPCPRIPTDVEIREYQKQAISNWKENGFTGIFDMATGTGKTYTALAAIATLYDFVEKQLAVIIVCPYQHLVEQWKEDIDKFGMKPIICYSASSQKDWRTRLKTAVTGFNLGVNKHFCVISTNATFSSQYVQDQIGSLKGKTLLVIDEAHNFGAENLSRTLLPNMKYRLALSATIDRHGDEDGTQKLYDYFGKKCIEYTLKEAIDNGMLTPYYYHPVVVALNEDELTEYLELTSQIVNAIHSSKKQHGKVVLSEYAKMLLIKRARIVAGANEKISMLRNVIVDYKNDDHMLVYCGATTMHDVDYKEDVPPADDIRQIDIVADLLGNELSMRVSKFTSEESSEERETLKTEFADGKHQQVLIAIRCLDEGVNIPSIKTAFILASSTNPKEYIQRRGRVLRTYKGKNFATIYDFITLPIPLDSVSNYSSEVCNSVKSLAIREMIRMKDFASISENPSEVDKLVWEIKDAFNITPEDERSEQDV